MVQMKLFAGQESRCRHREWTCAHGEKRGVAEMYGKSNKETYITTCRIDSQQNLPYGSGNSNRASVST